MRRVVKIFVNFTATTGHQHPHLGAAKNNYEILLSEMGRDQNKIHQILEDILKPLKQL